MSSSLSHYAPTRHGWFCNSVSVLRETPLNLCWKSHHCQCVIASAVSWLWCWRFIFTAGHRSHSYSLLKLSSQESNEERQCYRAQHSDYQWQAQQIGHQFCAKNGKLDTTHRCAHRELSATCVGAQGFSCKIRCTCTYILLTCFLLQNNLGWST